MNKILQNEILRSYTSEEERIGDQNCRSFIVNAFRMKYRPQTQVVIARERSKRGKRWKKERWHIN